MTWSDVVSGVALAHVVGRFAQALVLEEQLEGAIECGHVLDQLRVAPTVERVLGDALEVPNGPATDCYALGRAARRSS